MLKSAPAQIVIGTAGHVDHGKSTLIHKLTGTDPDRLPQEKLRGLTIELGFAFLPGDQFDKDCDLGFVVCPGHSKFLRHAIAGMGAMNGCLLIIAADEGISAQTREHVALLRLLNVAWGRIIITKSGLASTPDIAQLCEEALQLCSGTPFAIKEPLITDALAGIGLEELRDWLFNEASTRLENTHQDYLQAPPRLGIDRVFTVKGHGTVVTGTLLSGSLTVGDTVQCFPGPTARIRGLHVRSLSVESAFAGQRCAINLAGVDRHDIERGAWLAAPDSLKATTQIDIGADIIEPGLKHGDALQIHHGTGAYSGRIVLYAHNSIQGSSAIQGSSTTQSSSAMRSGHTYGQLRLDTELYLRRGDQLVLRRPSPSATLGAATVLAVDAPRHKRFHADTRRWFDSLQGDAVTRLSSWLEMRDHNPAIIKEVEEFCGSSEACADAIREAGINVISRHLSQGHYVWGCQSWHRVLKNINDYLKKYYLSHIDRPWFPLDSLRKHCAPECPAHLWEDRLAAAQAEGQLLRHQRLICVPEILAPLSKQLNQEISELLSHYQQRGLQAGYDNPECEARPDPQRARQALQIAGARGWLIRLSDRQHLHRDVVSDALRALGTAFTEHESIDFQWAKAQFAVSRRYLVPLLEWCDLNDLTQRHGNLRHAGSQLGDGSHLPIPQIGRAP